MPLSHFSDWESGARRDVSVESVRPSEGYEPSIADFRDRRALMAFVKYGVSWTESGKLLRGQLGIRQDGVCRRAYPGESHKCASFKTRFPQASRLDE